MPRRELNEHRLPDLIQAGNAIWEDFWADREDAYHLFIPCDPMAAYRELDRLKDRATTFLELGSAAGVVTIIADMLGYDAYGIEIEGELVSKATDLARQFGSRAVFAEGTFVPPGYQEDVEHLPADYHTPTGGRNGYEELGLDLEDFDLVFGYPWPGEEEWLEVLAQRYMRPGSMLMTFAARHGFDVIDIQ